MSPGSRSGVNCWRLKVQPSVCANSFVIVVLARPGLPSTRMCPSASRHEKSVSMSSSFPTITRWSSSLMRCAVSATMSMLSGTVMPFKSLSVATPYPPPLLQLFQEPLDARSAPFGVRPDDIGNYGLFVHGHVSWRGAHILPPPTDECCRVNADHKCRTNKNDNGVFYSIVGVDAVVQEAQHGRRRALRLVEHDRYGGVAAGEVRDHARQELLVVRLTEHVVDEHARVGEQDNASVAVVERGKDRARAGGRVDLAAPRSH